MNTGVLTRIAASSVAQIILSAVVTRLAKIGVRSVVARFVAIDAGAGGRASSPTLSCQFTKYVAENTLADAGAVTQSFVQV